MQIDLNADAGESFGAWTLGDDAALCEVVTSISIACGCHAGDPLVIRETLQLARRSGVSVGAHPSFPDRQGFGRRVMHLSPRELEATVLYQVAAVFAMARAEGLRLRHVKPHGALFHLVMTDVPAAEAFVRAVSSIDRSLCLVGLAGSALDHAGQRLGLDVVPEAYADRAYEADGSLTPRTHADALITDPRRAAVQALDIVLRHHVRVRDGSRELPVTARTLCVHGDTPGAPAIARAVRDALEGAGIDIASL